MNRRCHTLLAPLLAVLAFLLGLAGSAAAAFNAAATDPHYGNFLLHTEAPARIPLAIADPARENGVWLYDSTLGVPVYVNQNPWTKYDPEGLFWSAAINIGFAAWDTYQVVAGNISKTEYAGRMALTGAALVADAATGGMGGGVALRAASVAARAGKAGQMAVKAAIAIDKADTAVSAGQAVFSAKDAIAEGNYGRAALSVAQVAVTAKGMTPSAREVAGATARGIAANRLAQDVKVNPTPPAALPTSRAIGNSPTQNVAAQAEVQRMQEAGYADIRINQQQVNAQGQRVGTNRPDLQGTSPAGQREYHEFDTSKSTRGPGHEARIRSNDESGSVKLRKVD